MAAEGAGTDGTTNVRGRSIDCNTRRTTVRKLYTDCVKFMEQTSPRVSPVVAETAHTDGTRVGQYKWDYLEIPEPRLPRVFLDLAEEARNIKVDSGRPCYTEEVQPQGTGLTRPVFVTVMVDSPPVLKKGAVRATGVSTKMIQIMNSAGRCEPVDRSGLVGPQSKTEQPVLLGLHADQVGNAPAGPVGPDIMMDRIQPVAQGPVGLNDSDRPTDDGPVGWFIKHSPVGPDRIPYTCDFDRPVADGPMGRFLIVGPVGPKRTFSLGEPNQPVADGPIDRFLKLGPMSPKRTFSLDEPNQPVAYGPMNRVLKLGPVSPKRTFSLDEPTQPVADGPIDRVLKLGPVNPKRTFFLDEPNQPVAVGPVGQAFTPGPVVTHVRVADCKRILSTCDPDRPVADDPMDRFLKLGPVGPKSMFSLDELYQPVAVGPVGQAVTHGPMGTHVRVPDCKRMDQMDDSPLGSTEILDPVNQTGRPIQTDLMKIGTINRTASLGDTPPSSDSGVHSLGEQWENMSTNSMDLESEQNERPTYGSTMRRR